MHMLLATSIILAAMTTGAQASSIVVFGPDAVPSGQSMVVRGTPPQSSLVVSGDSVGSPSIVSFGEPARSVDAGQVAAIPVPKAAPRGPAQLPMVMRGGIAGEAFARAETAPQPPQQEEPAAEPETAQAPDGAIRLAPPDEPPSEPPVEGEDVPDGPVLR